MNAKNKKNLTRDLIIIGFSFFVAVLVAVSDLAPNLLTATSEVKFLGSFIAGMFFTSIFTTAPATVVLFEISKANSILEVALLGGLGALVGDLVIFRFFKNSLAKDIGYLTRTPGIKRLAAIFKTKLFRYLIPFLGALIIASPLPDEIGLALMGFSKLKTRFFIPLSFVLNSLGILLIGLIAKN